MHPLMVKEIVARCRQRQSEGDCPTVPPFSREQLEDCIVQMASDTGLRHARDALTKLLDFAIDYDQTPGEAREELEADGVDVDAFLERVRRDREAHVSDPPASESATGEEKA